MAQKPNDLIYKKLNEAIIKVANERDKKAFGVLFIHFASRLFYFGLKKTGDPQKSRDIVQETLATIWQKAHLFDQDKGSINTWIYTIARNVCYDMGRKQARLPQMVSSEDLYDDHYEYQTQSEEHIDLEVDKEVLHRLVHRLPKKQSDVIELIYLHDMSQQDVAEHLQLPLGTVKSRIRLALIKLKDLTIQEMKGYE